MARHIVIVYGDRKILPAKNVGGGEYIHRDGRATDRHIDRAIALELRTRVRRDIRDLRRDMRERVRSARHDEMKILMAHATGAYITQRLGYDPLAGRINGYHI